MKTIPTAIQGLLYLESPVYADDRGDFLVGWRLADLQDLPGWRPFVQESLSTSRRGVLRGLHLQHPRAQGKLIRVLSGNIFDVAVDLRPGSSTYRKWVSSSLHADGRALWIPPGFAHGFLACSEQAVVLYQVTDDWVPQVEITIRWNDPSLGIDWPLEGEPILSARDATAPLLNAVGHRLKR